MKLTQFPQDYVKPHPSSAFTKNMTALHITNSINRSPLRLGFLLVPFALAAMLSGCATSDFHQYTGAQQNWPTASGALVSTKYDVPAYYGPPDRPYIVLGSLDATTVRGIGQDESSAVQDAARVAKRMGANAIIVIGSGREQVGTSSFGTVSTHSSGTGGFYGAAVGNSVYGRTYGSGSSTSNMFGSSFGSYQGKASVLVIKFK